MRSICALKIVFSERYLILIFTQVIKKYLLYCLKKKRVTIDSNSMASQIEIHIYIRTSYRSFC